MGGGCRRRVEGLPERRLIGGGGGYLKHVEADGVGQKVVLVGPTIRSVIAACACTVPGVGAKRAGMLDRKNGTGAMEGGPSERVVCYHVRNPCVPRGDRSGAAGGTSSWHTNLQRG